MIHIQYDDYLTISKNLKNIKNKEEVEKSLDTIESLFDKIREENRTLNDGRD
jgi:antitoxin component HigA of HigAB toxin-antitoxin module